MMDGRSRFAKTTCVIDLQRRCIVATLAIWHTTSITKSTKTGRSVIQTDATADTLKEDLLVQARSGGQRKDLPLAVSFAENRGVSVERVPNISSADFNSIRRA